MHVRTPPTRPLPFAPEPSFVDLIGQKPLPDPWQPRSRYAVDAHEQRMLDQGDVVGFWSARLGRDPVARTGVAIWGGPQAVDRRIDAADDAQLQRYWIPKLGLISRFVLWVVTGRSAPKTREDARAHWHWMGTTAQRRLRKAIRRHLGPRDMEQTLSDIGLQLARAHARAVHDDIQIPRGDVPGVLSAEQIADVHHEVLLGFGLPANTFGGTPFKLLPDSLELWMTADLYNHDGDRRD